ncbi:MAG: glycoside hydrolase family 3 C-terminal domain-containing protein [Eubacteriales bacterium]
MEETIKGFYAQNRMAAAEGMVLLKNENNTLPIATGESIALFGRCQIQLYRSGTGSGGCVQTAYHSNLVDGFPAEMLNQELLATYQQFIEENPFDTGGSGWAAEPWCQKELELTPAIVQKAKETSSKAVVVIGRTAGEDKDNQDVTGSYRLTDLEETMLKEVTAVFDKVVVVMNTSNIMDMSWLDRYPVDSILYAWNGGMEGGYATADVLLGKMNPSGKLPDTIAKDMEDYSSTKNHGGVERNIYEEDIYVGYRYFETFAPEKVQFPFGFGLSYTTFEISNMTLKDLGEDSLKVTATVCNTGNQYKGKEVVQVYLNPPQGKLGKATRNLVGFAKTKELAPKESQELEITIPKYYLASYDDSGVTGHKSAYVLEAGTYDFYLGNSVKATEKQSITIDNLVVVKQLQEALAPKMDFQRMKPSEPKGDGTYTLAYEAVPTMTVDLAKRIADNIPAEIPYTGDKGIKLPDVKAGKAAMTDFVAQFSPEELCMLVCGEGMSHPHVTPGTASAFAGVTASLRDYGIPLICCADGPSGVRMSGEIKSTQVPIGTLLAASWDVSLMEDLYTFTGKEMAKHYVDVLLGPGMNLHRHPLNGRNFEYFSEDPLLTGLMASAVVKGIRKAGVSATLKHFACNSQETHRHSIDSVLSERAARELYLRGFELAVTDGTVDAIMTAYNPVNGIWTASNYDLNTTILRGEWGYTGFLMTDWWARMNHPVEGGDGKKDNLAAMVMAQNDVYMVQNNFDADQFANITNLQNFLDQGKLSVAELQRCGENIFRFAMDSNAQNREFSLLATTRTFTSQEMASTDVTLTNPETSMKITGNQGVSFHCPEAGKYEIYMDFSLSASELAQVFFQIKLNDQEAAVLLARDTREKCVRKKLNDLILEKGSYQMELQAGSDTFIIENIMVKKI